MYIMIQYTMIHDKLTCTCTFCIQNGLLSEEQYAFITDRNITTPAITRRLMMEDAQSRQRQLVLLDIDLTHGYDTVETWAKDAALTLSIPAHILKTSL